MKSEQEIRDELTATAALASDYKRNNNHYGEQIAQDKLKTLEWVLGDSATPERKEPAPLPENTDNSVFTNHMHWVKQLEEQGVMILMPEGECMHRVYGYILTEKLHKNAGCIFKDKDGTFGLFGDMGAIHITGIRWEDLGLCDARCWYEWMDDKKKDGE